MRKTKAVIFDMDGLLLATEEIYSAVTTEVVALYGKKFSWEIKSMMMGRSASVAYQILVDQLELPVTACEIATLQEPLLVKKFASVEAMPGAQALTRLLKRLGLPMALATSSSQKLYQVKTQKHRAWFSDFQAIVTGDEVRQLKPAPDIFLEAAQRLGVPPRDCLVFEDAVSGVQAAKAAGMEVVAVLDPRSDRTQYLEADLTLGSLEQFDWSVWNRA